MSDRKKFDELSGFDPQVWERTKQGERVPGPLTDQQLGPYRMGEMLGVGTFSTVYRARHSILRAERAIKILRPDFAQDPRFVNPFRYEAAVGASLDHPNTVKVHDAGFVPTEETPSVKYHYIAMEYVDGRPMSEVFTPARRPNIKTALNIIDAVSEGLNYAHEKGVIHSDLKPSNIILTRDGEVKLADFGSAVNVNWTALTNRNNSVTAGYTAPEVLSGETTTFKSDLFALGVIGFELLTGKPPSKSLRDDRATLIEVMPKDYRSVWIMDSLERHLAPSPGYREGNLHTIIRAVRSEKVQNSMGGFMAGRLLGDINEILEVPLRAAFPQLRDRMGDVLIQRAMQLVEMEDRIDPSEIQKIGKRIRGILDKKDRVGSIWRNMILNSLLSKDDQINANTKEGEMKKLMRAIEVLGLTSEDVDQLGKN